MVVATPYTGTPDDQPQTDVLNEAESIYIRMEFRSRQAGRSKENKCSFLSLDCGKFLVTIKHKLF
jgi:hypothetical protein